MCEGRPLGIGAKVEELEARVGATARQPMRVKGVTRGGMPERRALGGIASAVRSFAVSCRDEMMSR